MLQTLLTPSVAVVILNYNGRHFLQQFLPSVIASSYANLQVVVADNASTDDSLPWLAAYHPAVAVIKLGKNHGFALGYNLALQQVQADYFVLLNSDVEVTPGWLQPVIDLMQGDAAIGACQPKILAYHHKTQFEYAGACGGWMDAFGYPFSRGRVFDDCETDNGQYDDVAPVFWASGAALFVRAAVFLKAGGFDPWFFAHQEEIDLCWRLQKAGYKVMVCPQSVVYHVGGGTLPRGGRKVYLNFRNNLVMLAKHWPIGHLLWKLPVRWALDVVAALKALAGGDVGFFAAVVKAHVAFLGWIFSHRLQPRLQPVGPPLAFGYYQGCIVWAYFISNKKTFAEIVGESQ